MKSVKYLLYLLLGMFGLSSCNSDGGVLDLANMRYVRINKKAVTLAIGENYRIVASFDSEETASRKFKWSTFDASVATVTMGEDNSGIITGVSEGETVIKVESEDGSLTYYADLYILKERATKILVIGNNFSEDAVENYLYDLAVSGDKRILIGNLFLDNASLLMHQENATNQNAVYQLRKIAANGSVTKSESNYSIKKTILEENWDYICFQELNALAGMPEGYRQNLPPLLEYVKTLATNPDVKYALHQTWASGQDQETMYAAIVDAVVQARQLTGIGMVIPTGTAIQNGRTSYLGDKFTRDGARLSLGIGRFTAACTWYEAIFGDVLANSFFPDIFSEYDGMLAKTAAAKAVAKPAEVTVLDDYLEPEPYDFEPVFIDFGHVVSAAPYNHYGNPRDGKLSNLKNILGEETGWDIDVAYGFADITLDRGLTNILGMPVQVSSDMFFADGKDIAESGLVVSNLDKAFKYTFTFYGAINDNGTQTAYKVTGKNEGAASLVTDYNDSKLAVVKDIIPNDDGTVRISLKPGEQNTQWARFYCVNALFITPQRYALFQ